MPNDLQSPLDRHIVTFMDRLTAENYKPQTIKAYRGLLKRLIALIEAAGISQQDLTAERAAEVVRNDVLPKALPVINGVRGWRSEEHTSELQSLMRNSYAVFCLQK